jgi:hypothetical protein
MPAASASPTEAGHRASCSAPPARPGLSTRLRRAAGLRRLRRHRAGRKLGRLQGRGREGQDPGHDGQRPAAHRRAEPNRFAGKAYTWYGRWTVQVRGSGAPGRGRRAADPHHAIASYAWSVPANSFTHERFHLAGPGNRSKGWMQRRHRARTVRGRGRPRQAARPRRAARVPPGRPEGRRATSN